MAHLINTRIAVFWPAEKAWFAGKVTKYDAKETAHHIVYDDGNLEWRDLKQFKWRKEKKKAAAKKKKKKAKKRGRRATKKKGGEPTAAAATPALTAARVAAAAAPAARPKAVVEKPEPDAKRRRTAASASSPRASPIAFAEADVTIGVTGDDSLLEQRATTDDDVAESDDADAALAQQLFGGAAEEEAEASKEKEKQKMPELFPPIEENREADAFAREASRASLLAMLHTRQTEIEHSPMRSAVKPRSVAQPAAALRPILVTFSASTSDADEEEEDTGSIADDDGEADVDLEEEEAAAAGDDVVALRTTDADRAFFVRAGAPAPAAPFAWRAPLLSSSSAAPVPAAAAAAPQQRQFQAHLQPSSTMAGRRRTSMQQPLLSPLGTLSSERAERRRGEKGLTGILKPTSASLDTRRGGSSSSSGAAAISSHQAPLSRFGSPGKSSTRFSKSFLHMTRSPLAPLGGAGGRARGGAARGGGGNSRFGRSLNRSAAAPAVDRHQSPFLSPPSNLGAREGGVRGGDEHFTTILASPLRPQLSRSGSASSGSPSVVGVDEYSTTTLVRPLL